MMLSNSLNHDGFFWPGDLGYLDADGWLFLTDRVTDVIITGGVNVYSTQVEAGLAVFDGVQECAVIGVSDPDWGEVVTAIVVPTPAAPDAADLELRLRELALSALAPAQRPKHYTIVDALPQTGAGKIDKRALRIAYGDLGIQAVT